MKISEMVRTVLELENEEVVVVPDVEKKESLLKRGFAGIRGGATAAGRGIKGGATAAGRGIKGGATAAGRGLKATGKLAKTHPTKTLGIGSLGAGALSASLANQHPYAAIGSGAVSAALGAGAGVLKLRAMHKKRAAAKAEAKAGE